MIVDDGPARGETTLGRWTRGFISMEWVELGSFRKGCVLRDPTNDRFPRSRVATNYPTNHRCKEESSGAGAVVTKSVPAGETGSAIRHGRFHNLMPAYGISPQPHYHLYRP